MRDEDVPLAVAGGGLILVLAFWKGRAAAQVVADVFTKGKRLTYTAPDVQGVIADEPADLAALASSAAGFDIPTDVYSLARMRRSEGTDGAALRMHVALNDLADLQARQPGLGLGSITDLVTYSKYPSERGYYGTQAGRRYGSSRDPFEGDVRLAFKVLAERQMGIDRTAGAVKFFDKVNNQKGAASYDQIVQQWGSEGLAPFTSPDATSNLVLFRRA